MELSPKQQINELIKTSQSILIVSHSNLDGDALGAMLALERVLTKMGKEISLVSSETIDQSFNFLPGLIKIKDDIFGIRDFIIRFNTDKTPVEKLSYNKEDNFLNVIISPKNDKLTQNDIEFIQGDFKFDLVFVLDTPTVDKIDKVYDRQTELFFETSIVNIDHHAGNEYFGAVNLVDLTATSTCEILVSIIESFGAGNFDEDVATCLLTGIITDTDSFKNINTTPKSLTISAQMLAAGARQQEIIQNLFKVNSYTGLKVWGKILAKLEYNTDLKAAISTLSFDELGQNQIEVADLKAIMDDSLLQMPDTDMALILIENKPNQVLGLVGSFSNIDVLDLVSSFGGNGNSKIAEFEITDSSLKSVINKLFTLIAQAQGKTYKNPLQNNKPSEESQSEINNEPREYLVEETENSDGKTVIMSSPEDPISKAIESIDQVIEHQNNDSANIDIEDVKKQGDSLKPLGNILENHRPGTALDENILSSPPEINGDANMGKE